MMPTKEQERKALAQIKTILANLGNNPETSYICRALDGCIAYAEENIENDFANSWKSTAESYQGKYEALKVQLKEEQEQHEARSVELNKAKMDFDKQAEMAHKWLEAYNEARTDANKAEKELEAAQLEIIKLKAKLYDYMAQG